jgi:hypothetical protein
VRRPGGLSADSRAALNWAPDALAAAGRARTTSRVPAGKPPRRAATRCRSCRRTRLRTTAPPTARDTTKPARGGRCSPAPARPVEPTERCATRRLGPPPALPPVRPRPARSVAAKSERRRNRAPAGSTPVRPRAASDPWPGDPPEWRARRGCASAGGTRGSSPADGCSAGTCACSLVGSRTTVWSGGNVPKSELA